MNKELEALLLSAAKALDLGVVGVDEDRARAWGVPVGSFVQAGEVIPGHSKKAKTSGYYCPYSVWRPPTGECLMLDHGESQPGKSVYQLVVLRETDTGHGHVAGRIEDRSLAEMKAYLRGLADGADRSRPPKKRSRRR
jgi:hypothetical protein